MPRKRKWRDFQNLEVAAVFDNHPPGIRIKLMRLRELVFETAQATEGVGEIEEALRWGEPSYLTRRPKSGTTIRIGSKTPDTLSLFVHCQTDLVARFRTLYPKKFRYDGTRSITWGASDDLPEGELARFISMALTYHLRPRSRE